MLYPERDFQSPLLAPRPPISVFAMTAVIFAIALVLASQWAFERFLEPLLGFAIASLIAAHALLRGYRHAVLGACNVVTLARLAIVAFLIGTLTAPTASSWLVLAIALVAFSMDGIDGWLARRYGLVSEFGARFDMETDAALAAVLALWLLLHGQAGPEVLVLGFARYAFVAAGFFVPRLKADLPPSFRRKAVCVIQISALLLLVFPLTPAALAPWVSFSASLALLWSFAVDTLWLLRRPG